MKDLKQHFDSEKIIKVDIFDNEIGSVDKLSAHTEPVLHRAFSVFLINENKMLIQKRAANKYHSGGLWANSCCSHPRAGKTFLDSVNQRVEFELGISEILEYTKIFEFTYHTEFNNGLHEYEYDHVLVANYKGEVNFNTSEIEEVLWIDVDVLKNDLILNPNKYSSWFKICAPKVISYLYKK